MTSILANGGLARILKNAAVSARVTETATLHVRAGGTDADGVPATTFTDYPATITPLDISAFRREAGRIPDTETEALMYQHGAAATPRTDDEITIRGSRFLVVSRPSDAAGATWALRLRALS